MKKFLSIFIVSIISVTVMNNAVAQNAKDVSMNFASFRKVDYAAIPGSSVNTISAKAIKHFKETFKDATNTEWFQSKDGFVAFFTLHGMVNRTYYSRNGNWVFSVKYYDESKLPVDVRAAVKSSFYDFSIETVEEITMKEKTVYLVDIQDKNSRKTIRVCDGEMEIINDFQKLK